VVESNGQQAVIRFEGIDAPEHNQEYGDRAKQNLIQLVSGKTVTLDCNGQQSYGRLVCNVLLPSGEDVGLDQVTAGLAWHYKQYEDGQTPADRSRYAAAEDTARGARLGLWANPHPVQPWDFRHETHTKLCFAQGDHRITCAYEGPVRGNVHSHKYHWPGCPNYDDISPANRVEFTSRETAQAAGYRPAHNCPWRLLRTASVVSFEKNDLEKCLVVGAYEETKECLSRRRWAADAG
jgi:hypothetical protein